MPQVTPAETLVAGGWRAASLLIGLLAVGTITPAIEDRRSRELLSYECRNDLGRRQLTLFANGTVRVRDGLFSDERMKLGEIPPDVLDGYIRRLEKEDLSEAESTGMSPQGEWVERCRLILQRRDRASEEFEFSYYDALPLALSRVVRLADELEQYTMPIEGFDLPLSYEPRPGDVLRRSDDVLFEVIGFTSDNLGIELQGVEQPITIYISVGDLRPMFVKLESRRSW